MTNMTRYVTFVLANEYHMIADLYEANINKIIDACNTEYPRLNLPGPSQTLAGLASPKTDGTWWEKRLFMISS